MLDLRSVEREPVDVPRPWWKFWAPRVSRVERVTYQLSRDGKPGATLTYCPDPGPQEVCARAAIAYAEPVMFAAPEVDPARSAAVEAQIKGSRELREALESLAELKRRNPGTVFVD